jgi:hypothetical protein
MSGDRMQKGNRVIQSGFGAAWIEAGEIIRRLRTFEHEDAVRLDGAPCDGCDTELRLRRRSGSEELAAYRGHQIRRRRE